jgi:hypothetical protein
MVGAAVCLVRSAAQTIVTLFIRTDNGIATARGSSERRTTQRLRRQTRPATTAATGDRGHALHGKRIRPESRRLCRRGSPATARRRFTIDHRCVAAGNI